MAYVMCTMYFDIYNVFALHNFLSPAVQQLLGICIKIKKLEFMKCLKL